MRCSSGGAFLAPALYYIYDSWKTSTKFCQVALVISLLCNCSIKYSPGYLQGMQAVCVLPTKEHNHFNLYCSNLLKFSAYNKLESNFIKELTPTCPAHSPWICHDLPSQFWMQNIIIHALSACYIQDWRQLFRLSTILCRNLDQGCRFILFRSNNYVGINEISLIFFQKMTETFIVFTNSKVWFWFQIYIFIIYLYYITT